MSAFCKLVVSFGVMLAIQWYRVTERNVHCWVALLLCAEKMIPFLSLANDE